ncbi:phage tail protein [Labrys miyagiensis]|uniref:Phage tail protein n=1 Tax=Labrys miyagiensis TaxID=346912 RepID=A0ABQ6CR92_9HYPH|nr:phage baseplate assembly protein V [Labrys miyagiensis]GLS21239.1 phage tail protein [Labrys miyagiensis]
MSDNIIQGVMTGTVRDNRDPDAEGRVQVIYSLPGQSQATQWARMAVPVAGGDRGFYFLPDIGDEVLLAFEGGDPRRPYVVGALWNGRDRPPATNGDGKNNIHLIRTRNGSQLTFNDGDGSSVRIELNDGKKVELDNAGLRLEDSDGNRLAIDSQNGSIVISATKTLTLKAPDITVEASGTLKTSPEAMGKSKRRP